MGGGQEEAPSLGLAASLQATNLMAQLQQTQRERDEARAIMTHLQQKDDARASSRGSSDTSRAASELDRLGAEMSRIVADLKKEQRERLELDAALSRTLKEKQDMADRFKSERQRDAQNRLEMQRAMESLQASHSEAGVAVEEAKRHARDQVLADSAAERRALEARVDEAVTKLAEANKKLSTASMETEGRLELISLDAEAAHKVRMPPTPDA